MRHFYSWSMAVMLLITVVAMVVAYRVVAYDNGLGESIGSLSEPAIAQSAFDDVARTDYLNLIDNAGFTAYINVGQQLEPSLISASLKNVAFSGDDHIGGNMLITDYDSGRLRYEVEGKEVQVFVHRSGWILVYLTRSQDPVLAIDWLHYGSNRLTETTLSLMLKSILDTYQLDNAGTIQYYDFAHPTANNFMILATSGAPDGPYTSEMNIMVPDSINLLHIGVSYALINNHPFLSSSGHTIACNIDGEEIVSFADPSTGQETYIGHAEYDKLSTFYNFEHSFMLEMANRKSFTRCGMILVYEES